MLLVVVVLVLLLLVVLAEVVVVSSRFLPFLCFCCCCCLFLLLEPDPRKNSGVSVFRCVLGGLERGDEFPFSLMLVLLSLLLLFGLLPASTCFT